MPEAARSYQQTVWYLQHRISAQGALTRAGRVLKDAYARIAVSDPSIALLEAVRADIDVALREARAMANMDDAAVVPGEPAA